MHALVLLLRRYTYTYSSLYTVGSSIIFIYGDRSSVGVGHVNVIRKKRKEEEQHDPCALAAQLETNGPTTPIFLERCMSLLD